MTSSSKMYTLHTAARNTKLICLSALCVIALSACGGGSSNDRPANDGLSTVSNGEVINVADPNQCNGATQKQWAYDSMNDFYLFADQVPVVDPQVYESADDVVRNVRFEERDSFSNVSDAARSSLASDEGREFGLGYRWLYDNNNFPRIALAYDDSPFGRAGIERGDIIKTVNGLDWRDPALDEIFEEQVRGTPDNAPTSRWEFRKRDTNELVQVSVTPTEYTINTVLETLSIPHSSGVGALGYLAFSRFLETSEAELNSAFNFFAEENITELVLDLRYNGGGRIRIAQLLATMIAGDQFANQPIYNYRFNDKYAADRNYSLNFLDGLGSTGLSRVIILTTGRTASASEIIVAGLQPYIEVVTIGSRTVGKPYSSYNYQRCGEQLNVIEAEGFNAAGNSVFDGVPATCFAEDNVTHDFGYNFDSQEYEGMLQAGMDYLNNGTCDTETLIAARSGSARFSASIDESNRQGALLIEDAQAKGL